MKAPEEMRLWMQGVLRFMSVDDASGYAFIPYDIPSPASGGHASWQYGVDLIYRCVRSGLVLIHNYAGCTDETSYFKAIQTLSPFEDQGGLVWNGTLLYGSELLLSLSKEFGALDEKYAELINEPFMDEIRQRFSAAGVSWSDVPLLPVAPALGSF